jgi:hypothetical protein
MSPDYRRLFCEVYGMTEEALGFSGIDAPVPLRPPPQHLVTLQAEQLVEASAQLRHSMDLLIARSSDDSPLGQPRRAS